jgi:hypothetical protein
LRFGRANQKLIFFPAEKKTLLSAIMSVSCVCHNMPIRETEELGPFFPENVPTTDAAEFVNTFGLYNGFTPNPDNTGPVILDGGAIVALPFMHNWGTTVTKWAAEHCSTRTVTYDDAVCFTYILVPCATKAERDHLLNGVYKAVTEDMPTTDAESRYALTKVWKKCLRALASGRSDKYDVVYNIMRKNNVPGTHRFISPHIFQQAKEAAPQAAEATKKREREDQEPPAAEPLAEVEPEKRQCTVSLPLDKSQHPIFAELEAAVADADMTVFYDSLEDLSHFGGGSVPPINLGGPADFFAVPFPVA